MLLNSWAYNSPQNLFSDKLGFTYGENNNYIFHGIIIILRNDKLKTRLDQGTVQEWWQDLEIKHVILWMQ